MVKETKIYSFEESPIHQVIIKPDGSGKATAFLYANSEIDSPALYGLPTELAAPKIENKTSEDRNKRAYYHAYPDVVENQNVLVVPQLPMKEAEHLVSRLYELGAVTGKATYKEVLPDADQKKGFTDQIKGHTLELAGAIGLPGHAAMAIDGILNGRASGIMAGLGVLNPLVMSIYGNGDKTAKFDNIINEMEIFFANEGIKLPKNHDISPTKNFFSHIEQFIHEHPQQVGFGLGNIGAINGIIEGYKNKDILQGYINTTSFIGNLIVTFVPEKKRLPCEKENQEEKGAFENFWDWVQDSPLRANGALNFMDNIAWGLRTVEAFRGKSFFTSEAPFKIEDGSFYAEHEDMQKLHPWLVGTTAVSFGLSTLLASISSQNATPEELNAQFNKLFAASAKFLVEMPPEHRDIVLDKMSMFLSMQRDLEMAGMTSEKVRDEIEGRISILEQSPWVKRDHYQHLQNLAIDVLQPSANQTAEQRETYLREEFMMEPKEQQPASDVDGATAQSFGAIKESPEKAVAMV